MVFNNVLMVIHIASVVAIIVFILMQRPSQGGALGIGSGSPNDVTVSSFSLPAKLTALLGFLFFVTSLGLALADRNKHKEINELFDTVKVESAIEEIQMKNNIINDAKVPNSIPSAGNNEIGTNIDGFIDGDIMRESNSNNEFNNSTNR